MLRGCTVLFLALAAHAFGGSVQTLPALPNATVAKAVQVDSAGNIYVAGWFYPNPPAIPAHAFVGKLSPDGSQVIWWKTLAGSQDDRILAMALGADNSVYVTGTTSSTDFPTTQGSLQAATSVSGQAFAAKLTSNGSVVYATYIGGSAITSGNAIAVDSSGRAFITGNVGATGVFPTSPGAVTGVTSIFNGNSYIVELNGQGSAAPVAVGGFGGSAIAVDGQGNIYASGSFVGPLAPTTSGAFQSSTVNPATCFSGFAIGFYCGYQHIAKIDPTGTKLIYGTYLTGGFGAQASAMVVDAQGNLIVAGNTNSPDYPTTPGAYQPEYFAIPTYTFAPPHDSIAPVSAGFVTKLSASGGTLLWSTLFAGSNSQNPFFVSTAGDTITGMVIDAAGNILIAGTATSNDLPGLWATPVAQRPTTGQGFVARFSSDGTTLSATQLIPGVSVTGVAMRGDGSVIVVGGGSTVVSGVLQTVISAVSVSPSGRVAAISDAADSAKIVRVAPGQLLTLYGTNLAPTGSPGASSSFPTSFNGVSVTFNGIAAPILYTSGIQINLQVPFEIAGQTQVTMQVSSAQVSPPVSESYILGVAVRQPSVFIAGSAFSQPLFDVVSCAGQNVSGLQPLALNADGSQNSCANPAASGSVVTVFLNGLGVSTPSLPTGTISESLINISPAAVNNGTANFLSTRSLPGSIDSLVQVQIQVPSTASVVKIPLSVQQPPEGQFLVRGPGILIWIKPPTQTVP